MSDHHPASRGETGAPLEPISVRIRTAVQLTGISRSRIYELIAAGEIEAIKVGRSTLIPYRCLKRLVEPL